MTGQRVTAQVAPGAPAESRLREALKQLAAQTADVYVLVLALDARPGRELVPALVDGANALPKGCELIVVHPSPSLGFMVSSVALRVPHVRMTASAGMSESEPSEPATPASPQAAGAGDAADANASAITRAFASTHRTSRATCVILLDAGTRPSPTLVPQIVREVRGSPHVRAVYLVHPQPAAGFLASTLGLRVPNVSFRAVVSLSAIPDDED